MLAADARCGRARPAGARRRGAGDRQHAAHHARLVARGDGRPRARLRHVRAAAHEQARVPPAPARLRLRLLHADPHGAARAQGLGRGAPALGHDGQLALPRLRHAALLRLRSERNAARTAGHRPRRTAARQPGQLPAGTAHGARRGAARTTDAAHHGA
eukprot:scaffold5850_cov61-Phaeocystis_antarctica.AAC.5